MDEISRVPAVGNQRVQPGVQRDLQAVQKDSLKSRVVGSLGVSPTTSVILLGIPLYMNNIVFGVRPFLLYHRSGFHSPQPCSRASGPGVQRDQAIYQMFQFWNDAFLTLDTDGDGALSEAAGGWRVVERAERAAGAHRGLPGFRGVRGGGAK